MKVALIPPIPDLTLWDSTGISLLLSHLLSNKQYRKYYKERSAEDYLILDNSAHEYGSGNLPSVLLEQTKQVNAHEVVCPDVLFDAHATVEQTRRMLVYVKKEWTQYVEAGSPRLMLVPQGNNRSEWGKCLKNLLRVWAVHDSNMQPPVIGLSKDYDSLVKGGIVSLIDQYLQPLYEKEQMDVHCLGWPAYLWSLAEVHERFPWVRSTDSAKPFVYAQYGILLEPGGNIPSYPRRPPDYFDKPTTPELLWAAERNIRVFEAAATNDLILA